MNTDRQSESHSASRRGCRRVFIVGGVLILFVCGYPIGRFLIPGSLEIGPETTVIEGPLLPDGRVNYTTALNDRMSQGVTPDNNAAALLVQAFGPEVVEAEHRQEYFQLLGVPEPAADHAFVIFQTAWARRDLPPDASYDAELSRIYEQFGEARRRSWSREDFAEVAAWLDANEAPLETIVAATTRSRFFSPEYGGTDPPLSTSMAALMPELRSAARLLTTRAMLRLGEGNVAGAWDDLLACHRLSRLVGQEGSVLYDLVALSVSAVACASSRSLVHDEQLTGEQARRFSAELEALPPMPDFAASIDVRDRYSTLDSIESLARGDASSVFPDLQPLAGRNLDWNLIMQRINEHYDDRIAGLRLETHRDRIDQLWSLDAALQAEVTGELSAAKVIATALVEGRGQASRQFADELFAPYCQSFTQLCNAQARSEARLRLLQIAFMLAAYRAERGAFPEALGELSPDYLTEIPLDPFVDDLFHYERTEAGYRLYSVGDNMIDDGGQTYDSWPQRDDILIEAPPDPDERDSDL